MTHLYEYQKQSKNTRESHMIKNCVDSSVLLLVRKVNSNMGMCD